MSLVVYLGHGILHPVRGGFYFPQNQYLAEVLISQIEETSEKKQWLVHLYRSPRLYFF